MAAEYEIERSPPSATRCDCCGGLNVRLTRFVHRDGGAFAVYYATYTNHHPTGELDMLISLGEWGEDSRPDQRVAFYCRVRATDASDAAYEVMLDDVAESLWHDAEVVGRKLSRDEARAHPWKPTAFDVLDEAFARDPSLKGFVQRVQCGNAAVPLEQSFEFPDDVFALGDERDERSSTHGSFAALDDQRFFIRCLLPIPIENYGAWCVGLWVEVSKADYDRALQVWEDRDAYPKLRFSGTIANDVASVLDLPIPRGLAIDLHVSDADERPKVVAPARGELGELMTREWPEAEFEAYALPRGFL